MVVLWWFYVSSILVNILEINILTQNRVGYLKICAKKSLPHDGVDLTLHQGQKIFAPLFKDQEGLLA